MALQQSLTKFGKTFVTAYIEVSKIVITLKGEGKYAGFAFFNIYPDATKTEILSTERITIEEFDDLMNECPIMQVEGFIKALPEHATAAIYMSMGEAGE